jgi:hypothetical protein
MSAFCLKKKSVNAWSYCIVCIINTNTKPVFVLSSKENIIQNYGGRTTSQKQGDGQQDIMKTYLKKSGLGN